ncbi:MAG: GntR family transcriptional regulator [Chloroflexi bacterium]|nr:GntR family transcriptional regulator [Chloroflexota bacterium]MCC6895300.1 GntR family transcriptional regulator [Anaerolineae bacterium]
MTLNHIENRSLRDRVLDALREAIITGEIKPGQQLVETELAASLGVSRAPLREALQILSAEGLAETIPYHGTTVRRLTKADIEELYSLRSVLETFAIRRVIELHDPQHALVLRECFERMLAAAEAGALKQVNQIDREFHDTIIELTGHSLLLTSWSVVSMRVRQVMALLNRRNSDLKRIAYNHVPIIEAIEAGDTEIAVQLMEKHVAASGELIAEGWPDDAPQPDADA